MIKMKGVILKQKFDVRLRPQTKQQTIHNLLHLSSAKKEKESRRKSFTVSFIQNLINKVLCLLITGLQQKRFRSSPARLLRFSRKADKCLRLHYLLQQMKSFSLNKEPLFFNIKRNSKLYNHILFQNTFVISSIKRNKHKL